MRDVLMGREPSPVEGVLAMMEVADAYFARACEMEQLILRGEREGKVSRGSALYKFRTQELRSFKELAAAAANLGSRRLTERVRREEQERKGRESA